MLSTEDINLTNIPEDSIYKLQPWYIGLFTICKIVTADTTFELELPANYHIHLVFHVSKLKRYIANDSIFEAQDDKRPLPDIVNGYAEYEVECIVDKCIWYQKLQYLVKWKGYPEYEMSWEPLANLENA